MNKHYTFNQETLVAAFAKALRSGTHFPNIVSARKFASSYIDLTPETHKIIEEKLEQAIVLVTQEKQSYRELLELWRQQPNLGTRTSSSIRDQAFSTPIPLMYVLHKWLGEIDPEDKVFDPTAGHGILGWQIPKSQFYANEINLDRYRFLKSLFPNSYNFDALKWKPPRFNKVIMNPPFSGKSKKHYVIGGVKLGNHLDCALILKCLDSLEQNGRLVSLMRSCRNLDVTNRLKHYRSKNLLLFWAALYRSPAYKITQHITFDGKFYKKQGASYPVDMICVEKTSSLTELPPPHIRLPPLINQEDFKKLESLPEILKISNHQ